ncbi:MAG TPA: hypothetical protein VGW34_14370 [Allosphingosinicella sp.]|nr:hypothetical protein [Allosphingosinicella sp.]
MSREKLAASILLVFALLLVAAGVFALRYGHAAAWRVPANQLPWVERTLAVAAAGSGTPRERIRRTTRPRLWHRRGQICVTLATHRADGGGSYQACYDRRNGQLVEEREYGPCLCAEPLTDRLWELVW